MSAERDGAANVDVGAPAGASCCAGSMLGFLAALGLGPIGAGSCAQGWAGSVGTTAAIGCSSKRAMPDVMAGSSAASAWASS